MPKAILIPLNVFYYIVTVVLTIFHVLVLVPLLLAFVVLSRRGDAGDAARLANLLYGRIIVFSMWPFLRFSRRGLENFPRGSPAIVTFNHKSVYDIHFVAFAPSPNPALVVKTWPFRRLPVFSRMMRLAEYVDVDRLDEEGFIAECSRLLKKGALVCVAPEGARSRDGKLGKFRLGAFKLAQKTGFPIIPVCLKGNGDFEFHSFPLIRPAKVEFVAMEPIRPENFDPELGALEMRKLARKLYLKELGEEDRR